MVKVDNTPPEVTETTLTESNGSTIVTAKVKDHVVNGVSFGLGSELVYIVNLVVTVGEETMQLASIGLTDEQGFQIAQVGDGSYTLTTIGYCLLEPLNFTSYPSDPTLPQIKALPVNPTYLQGKLKTVAGMKITVHEASHPQFVERYVIYRENSGYEVLLLDAFYPKELDKKFEKHITKILNYNIQTFNIHLELPQEAVPESDDDEAAMSRLSDDPGDIPED